MYMNVQVCRHRKALYSNTRCCNMHTHVHTHNLHIIWCGNQDTEILTHPTAQGKRGREREGERETYRVRRERVIIMCILNTCSLIHWYQCLINCLRLDFIAYLRRVQWADSHTRQTHMTHSGTVGINIELRPKTLKHASRLGKDEPF